MVYIHLRIKTETVVFIIGLDEDQDALPFNDNELVRYLAVTNYDVKDKVVKFEGDEVPTDHTVVSHISYEGGNLPVVNSKYICYWS